MRPVPRPVLLQFLALCLALCACACSTNVASPLIVPDNEARESGAGRVSPVHEQWLYRQSMLGEGQEILKRVPATLLWHNSRGRKDAGLVLRHAPTWAMVPQDVRFADVELALPVLASLGLGGVWLGDVREGDLAWVHDAQEPREPDTQRTASLAPDPGRGGAERLKSLLAGLERQNLLGGMSLVAAATGLGPDFMLQARGSERHAGLYALFEIPRKDWALLPTAKGPWDVHALSQDIVRALGRALPPPLAQDSYAMDEAGYATTGEVLGLDGQTRRYAYRYYGSAWQPVLDWHNPMGSAQRLLQASAIQTTGIYRQALAGINVSALAGLDAAQAQQTALEPASTCLATLSGTVHRCGGWSLFFAPLSFDMAREALRYTDFCEAPGFARALQEAWQEGSTKNLAAVLEGSRTFDQKALAFVSPHADAARPATGAEGGLESGAERIARENHLLLALPCGLPGLCLLDARTLVRRRGHDAAPTNAGLLLAKVLEARSRLDLGTGRLVKTVLPSQSVMATIVALPRGGYMVTVLNFSRRPVQIEVETGIAMGAICCLTPEVQVLPASSPTSFALSLKARQAAHLVAGTDLSAKAKE